VGAQPLIPDPLSLAVFTGAALALLVVPGPAVLYIVTHSLAGGTRAGLVSMLGIQCGGLVHVLAAALGLSSLLVSSALAFDVVRYLGAAYLIVLGLTTLVRRRRPSQADGERPLRLRRTFLQGIVVNVLNPKTALFFFAFLPQFVDVSAGRVGVQILVLGCIFILLATLSDGTWAVAAGAAGAWLHRRRNFVGAQRWVSGSVFLGLGVATALSGARASQPPP
jgi:threonine/homoserine/homoserine lactone efflux protein